MYISILSDIWIFLHSLSYYELKVQVLLGSTLGTKFLFFTLQKALFLHWFCSRLGSIHSENLTFQRNLKSQTKFTSLNLSSICEHWWSWKLCLCRCVAFPARGPTISTPTWILFYYMSGGNVHIKTAKKQDFQLNRCPSYEKNKLEKWKQRPNSKSLSSSFLWPFVIIWDHPFCELLFHAILPCQNDNQGWMNAKHSYFSCALSIARTDFSTLGIKNEEKERDCHFWKLIKTQVWGCPSILRIHY